MTWFVPRASYSFILELEPTSNYYFHQISTVILHFNKEFLIFNTDYASVLLRNYYNYNQSSRSLKISSQEMLMQKSKEEFNICFGSI